MNASTGVTALSAAIVAGAATLAACSSPTSAPLLQQAEVAVTDFDFMPKMNTCPATTPVTLGGPGLPPTYSINFSFVLANQTNTPVTIHKVSSHGVVIGATNGLGLERPAHIYDSVFFGPAVAGAGQQQLVRGSITAMCGENPLMTASPFWDIATSLKVATTAGDLVTPALVFRRNWAPCDGSHPCPSVQPDLPANKPNR